MDGVYKEITPQVLRLEMTNEQVELLSFKCQKAELKVADNLTHAIGCAFSDKGFLPSHQVNMTKQAEGEDASEKMTPKQRREAKYGKWLKSGYTLTQLFLWLEERNSKIDTHFERVELERIYNELGRDAGNISNPN